MAHASIFPWSPLSQRRQLFFTNKDKKAGKISSDSKPLYPKCDATVWMRSCQKEIIKPIYGKTIGIIPTWVNGSLIRNGPGSLKVGNEEFQHLFDSSALLHRFKIKFGEVSYQCRFLKSEVFRKNWSANRIVVTEFGTKTVSDPCRTIFQRVAAIFNDEASDNSMISVYPFGDDLYAFGEIPIIHKINPETLDTSGKENIKDHISIINHTSHPHVINSGTVFNLGMTMYITGPHHIIACFPNSPNKQSKAMFEKAEIVASIPARWPLSPSYMHTFGITDNYFLIVEQPLTISLPGVISAKLKNRPLAGCFRWYHENYVQINVISRHNGKLCYQFCSEAFFYLHIINQYEKENHIILDICIYRDPSMLDCMYIETMKSMQHNLDYAKMFRGRPVRFVLPLKPAPFDRNFKQNLVTLKHTEAKAYYLSNRDIFVVPEKLCDLGCETPRINYDYYLGKPYRYFYAISSDVDSEKPGCLIKVDTMEKDSKIWWEENCYPSEPIFVPSPESKTEDDGVILSAMIWGKEDVNRVALLVLDAKTFTELGRVEFVTPGPVPKCLHGWFLPQDVCKTEMDVNSNFQ